MRDEPQPGIYGPQYRPDPRIAALAEWLGDPVLAADFPATTLRFRNQPHAARVGLDGLSEAEWIAHFGRFAPLPGNLPQPLALRYHGHQFRVYNPEIGDGRGFLFAQLRDAKVNGRDRLLDLGTKGSGQTPWSRQGDGRLTLKGAVREILATAMLEAQGVNTSRTFSVIETGEALYRGDEPSPTRSAVLVRLSHSHVRIGSFQRLAALGERDHLAALVDYCLESFPGSAAAAERAGPDDPAALLLHQVVERMADLAASYSAAGFVHGVLNTDNMNVTGESFDYGPWRWLPRWDPAFTAAYFDHNGLYAFGRQPEAIHWNCGQLAIALRQLSETEPLVSALERFPELYRANLARRFCWRLGVEPRGGQADTALIAAGERSMRESAMPVEAFFFAHRGGRGSPTDLQEALRGYVPLASDSPYWSDPVPQSMLIDEVEALWSAIERNDDWAPLEAKLAALARMAAAFGDPPVAAGHAA